MCLNSRTLGIIAPAWFSPMIALSTGLSVFNILQKVKKKDQIIETELIFRNPRQSLC